MRGETPDATLNRHKLRRWLRNLPEGKVRAEKTNQEWLRKLRRGINATPCLAAFKQGTTTIN
jgi:hypothetical protein